jgi:hypothetical protein
MRQHGPRCECLERVHQARDERQAAELARRKAVDAFHLAILEAIDSPACHHGRKEVMRAAGLTPGGMQTVLVGAARFDRSESA